MLKIYLYFSELLNCPTSRYKENTQLRVDFEMKEGRQNYENKNQNLIRPEYNVSLILYADLRCWGSVHSWFDMEYLIWRTFSSSSLQNVYSLCTFVGWPLRRNIHIKLAITRILFCKLRVNVSEFAFSYIPNYLVPIVFITNPQLFPHSSYCGGCARLRVNEAVSSRRQRRRSLPKVNKTTQKNNNHHNITTLF